MTGPQEVPDPGISRRGIMFWLPPRGFGNGVTVAGGWAELADIPESDVASVLFTLTEAGIGAYVADVHRLGQLPRMGDTVTFRLWVDALHYNHAQDELMVLLNRLHGHRSR